jgi:2-polyprenyl-3-methyl-5-hydroxy-6-metoxy-1,4-benzoquinol methylase
MGMLERAQRRLADCSGEIDLVQADACRLPFADDSFDVVFARGLLHHLPDPGSTRIARSFRSYPAGWLAGRLTSTRTTRTSRSNRCGTS